MAHRLLIVSLVLMLSAGYVAHASRPEVVPSREPLSRLPLSIQTWNGRDLGRFSESIERMLGVDEYVNRVYSGAAQSYVTLYLGYYQTQRQGDAIHSPLNCLPGAGWQPIHGARVEIPVEGGRTIQVNRFVIEKGIERQVVLYWYQSHGRVVASEYWSKAFMVYDAMRTNRTDAALVRVLSPVLRTEPDDTAAGQRAYQFVRDLYPLLSTHLPS